MWCHKVSWRRTDWTTNRSTTDWLDDFVIRQNQTQRVGEFVETEQATAYERILMKRKDWNTRLPSWQNEHQLQLHCYCDQN
jgi:hypothetical protein